MDFENKTFLVAGAGKSGIGACNLLRKVNAEVIIYDENENLDVEALKERLDDPNVSIAVGKLEESLLDEVDVMVISPGIPTREPFVVKVREANILIWSEVELAYQVGKGRLVAITGTNGKTTTTSLVGAIMAAHYAHVDVVGNIGNPYTTTAGDSDESTVTVAEISSFQLETIVDFKPDVSAILNITPDHLDRHRTMKCYADMKFRICENQEPGEAIVLNYEDSILRDYATTLDKKIVWFSIKREVPCGVYLEGDDIVYIDDGEKTYVTNKNANNLVGIHNLENIMAAIAISMNMDVPVGTIAEAIRTFNAVEHRLEYVDTIDDVIYYNDSKGTNTDASIKAIESMTRPTILIAGGYDKNSSFDEWADKFEGKIKCLVLLGQTSEKIADTVRAKGFENIIFTKSLEEAVEQSVKNAEPGDTVLLSPACASWGMFKNYEERGDKFKELVKNLRG